MHDIRSFTSSGTTAAHPEKISGGNDFKYIDFNPESHLSRLLKNDSIFIKFSSALGLKV